MEMFNFYCLARESGHNTRSSLDEIGNLRGEREGRREEKAMKEKNDRQNQQ